ncbi:MAG: tetrahydromethanopterin S-methyltransferase subunit A [Methanoregula sp.]|jgi:tetrahydromethanopterin S-methyltransferase subunit A|uniref:tetrahydromethanopterin S-methyltransferase subunit A n=1 Tax=Methanoregula sp. TaxID=2052170 RepID=UPI0025EEC08F|nr:tetrahydromethanopterin S-methyltransferase subunit A [Methanoregula sp.]MCK9632447.1 tetrahydromethanopterin S-methyltransferase subunit A [Methanoregula sp.]
MLKIPPHPEYPPEEGRYLRGNDYSPVAVVIILTYDAEAIPPEIEKLVRTGVEAGAALSGTLQTANIGIEKIICNVIANPNIRYLILGGPESEGHKTGDAIKALFRNGVDDKKRIIGTSGLSAYLYNVPVEFITRFREQVTLVDCQFQDENMIRKAVWSCFQEKPVEFRGQMLSDPGAFPEPPFSGRLTWNVTQPWAEPADDKERAAKQKALELIERLKKKQSARDNS